MPESSPATVTLKAQILDHQIIDMGYIPHSHDMTILSAMEWARDKDATGFSFEIGYFDANLGYLLFKVNQIGDQPCVYWDVNINGKPPQTGLDKQKLNAGDVVTMTFAWCGPAEAQASPYIAAKFALERQNPALQVQV